MNLQDNNILFNNIKENTNFKYIDFHFRREWVKLLYPHMTKFLKAVKNIPWDSYYYKGDAFFLVPPTENNENNNIKDYEDTIIVSGLRYNLFGGSVAEVLNSVYKKESGINIRDYVDPTGDFDIKISYNDYKRLGKEYDDIDIYLSAYNSKKELSPFIEDMTHWVFNQFSEQLEKNNLTSIENKTARTYKLDPESANYMESLGVEHDDPLFLSNTIGDYSIIRKSEPGMIKIQLSINIETNEMNTIMMNNSYTDHLIELVFTTSDENRLIQHNVGRLTGPIMDIKGIKCESFITWLNGQIAGYLNRLHIFNYNRESYILNKHKVVNHIYRIKYAVELSLFMDSKITDDTHYIFKSFLETINKDYNGVIQIDRDTLIPVKKFFKDYIEKYAERKNKKSINAFERIRQAALLARNKATVRNNENNNNFEGGRRRKTRRHARKQKKQTRRRA